MCMSTCMWNEATLVLRARAPRSTCRIACSLLLVCTLPPLDQPIDFARVRGLALGAPSPENVAALTILSSSDTTTELSLQQHLDIAPDLVAYNHDLPAEGNTDPLMMAQTVPHHATDKKRVKVYELRNNDWFDRGTGFCMANLVQVCRCPVSYVVALARLAAGGRGLLYLKVA